MNNVLVIYHANCTDGFGAAYAAWRKFGNDATYLPMAFGDPIPDLTGKNVFILDFSFSKNIYEELLTQANSIVLLDHHKHAYKNLCNCKGCFFDLSKSGAVLAWEYFHPNLPVPTFFSYIQDGDLLKFSLEETKSFYRGIHPLPYQFKQWQLFEDEDYLACIIEQGKSLEEFFHSQVCQIMKNAKPVVLNGKQGLMINATYTFVTEVGELLAKECGTFALVWYEEANHIKCSLRSGPNFDVSEIAMAFNGGGHPQASAFTVPSLLEFSMLIEKERISS